MAAEQNVLYGLMIVLISGLVGFAVYLATCGCKKDSGDGFKKIKYTTRKPVKKEKFDPPTNKSVNKHGPITKRESMKQQPLRQREPMKQQPLRPQLFGRPIPLRQRESMMVQAPLPTIDLNECPCTSDETSCPDGCACPKCRTIDFEPAGLAKSIVDTVSGTVAPEIYTQMHIPFSAAIKSDSRVGSDFLRGDTPITSPHLFSGQQTYQESMGEFKGAAELVFGIIKTP